MSMETLYSDGWDTDRKERKLRSQGKSVIEDKLAGGGGGGGSGSSNGNGSGSDASDADLSSV